jgi:hypothetical protein
MSCGNPGRGRGYYGGYARTLLLVSVTTVTEARFAPQD